MKKVLLVLVALVLLLSACKKAEVVPVAVDNGSPKVVIDEAIGFGDTETSAVDDARRDAIFRAFGTISDSAGNMQMVADGVCLTDSVLEKSQDDVKMWTVKIKAVVQKKL